MENRNAERARRNRESAKAEMEKLKAFYSFVFMRDMELVLQFERLRQASSGEQNEEAEAALIAEAVVNFDMSLFQK